MTTEQIDELVAAAIQTRKNAYAPYSQFAVGAAVLTADGRIFTGVNVENSSYGVTICAERFAFGAAIAAGIREFVAIAVASDTEASPCGACRQFMHEFGDDLVVLLTGPKLESPVTQTSLAELLPNGFRFNNPG